MLLSNCTSCVKRWAQSCQGVALNLAAAHWHIKVHCSAPKHGHASLACRVELVPAFVKLLRDVEAEVRVAAASKVSAFCKLLNHDQVGGPTCVRERGRHWCSSRWTAHLPNLAGGRAQHLTQHRMRSAMAC